MNLRVIESQWTPFILALRARRDVETAGIILAERLSGGEVLLARHLATVPDEGYAIRRIDQLQIDPVALNRLFRPARDGRMSIITVHTHPGTNQPWFSAADDNGDSRLIPSLFAQMPGPHGSAVIAGNSGLPAVRLWSECGMKTDIGVHVVGQMLRVLPVASIRQDDDPTFDRQRLA